MKNLTHPPNPLSMKRLDKKSFDYHTPLEAYVTRSVKLFDLSTQGQEEASLPIKASCSLTIGPYFPVDEG